MKKYILLFISLFLFSTCDYSKSTYLSGEEQIPDSLEICENTYNEVDGSIIDCDEDCELYSGNCYHLIDIQVLQDIRDSNESFSDSIYLLFDIGSQEWINGRLTELHIELQLTTIPESIGNLSSLEILQLYNNQLTTLPESFGNLSSLVWLYLNNNQLTSLPESIGNLSSLVSLHLNSNQLTSLPESICNLSEIDTLFIHGNNLCEEYNYDCIDNWETQDQSNCCEGENGEPNWTECP